MRISRSDRRALTLIFTVITTAICVVVLDRIFLHKDNLPFTLDELTADTIERQLVLPAATSSSTNNVVGGFPADTPSPSTSPSSPTPPREVETFAFDPNTADSTTLLRLGLAPWQVRAIFNYRAKGGRDHRAEDFKRVPGMTPELYERLAPHITIARQFRLYSDLEREAKDEHRDSAKADNPSSPASLTPNYQEKFRTPVVLDLNTVDTTTLKKVPGIASYRARRIVEYRSQLGGFVDVRQLMEIDGMPEEVMSWFAVESAIFEPIAINSSDIRTLARHPYLSYAQARAIVQYRHNYGDIKSLDALRLVELFTDADLQRLKPYIQF